MAVKYEIKKIEEDGDTYTLFISFFENGEEVCQLEYDANADDSIKELKSAVVSTIIDEFEDFAAYKPDDFIFVS